MFKCQFCGEPLVHVFCDLGHQPPSNSFLTKEQLLRPEVYYPLTAYVCDKCWLVQVPEVKKATEIFDGDYVYFSSQSPANVSHAKEYVDMITDRFFFPRPYFEGKVYNRPRVLEIGSNDGYMLQFFKEKGYEVLGIDPAIGPAEVANKQGVPTLTEFFGWKYFYPSMPLWTEKYDLICGINVLAHQPDINDFVKGLKKVLAPEGVITFEFPHLMRTVEGIQFDQIYHEHFSYFSFLAVEAIFWKHGLEVFDVEELPEHGGSLRIYARHETGKAKYDSCRVLLLKEAKAGVSKVDYYKNFNEKVQSIKHEFMEFLYACKDIGDTVIAYGAPAKGNTFLNFCGIKPDLIPCIIDRSPHKQGTFAPASHIPVMSEEVVARIKPAYIVILAWNLKEEISEQLKYTEEWGCKLITAVPSLEGVK